MWFFHHTWRVEKKNSSATVSTSCWHRPGLVSDPFGQIHIGWGEAQGYYSRTSAFSLTATKIWSGLDADPASHVFRRGMEPPHETLFYATPLSSEARRQIPAPLQSRGMSVAGVDPLSPTRPIPAKRLITGSVGTRCILLQGCDEETSHIIPPGLQPKGHPHLSRCLGRWNLFAGRLLSRIP